ncbi:hypothetical protein Tco_0581336 [Tanacetum coccineum]
MGSNIPTVFSWGSNIGLEGFLPSILLLVVIIVVVVIVVVTVILVVVVEGVERNEFHQGQVASTHQIRLPIANVTLFSSAHLLRENTDLVRVPVGLVFLLGLLVLAIVAACASRAATTLSATSFLMAA